MDTHGGVWVCLSVWTVTTHTHTDTQTFSTCIHRSTSRCVPAGVSQLAGGGGRQNVSTVTTVHTLRHSARHIIYNTHTASVFRTRHCPPFSPSPSRWSLCCPHTDREKSSLDRQTDRQNERSLLWAWHALVDCTHCNTHSSSSSSIDLWLASYVQLIEVRTTGGRPGGQRDRQRVRQDRQRHSLTAQVSQEGVGRGKRREHRMAQHSVWTRPALSLHPTNWPAGRQRKDRYGC
mmetsp:Transcript_22585/g.55714  ORF Transcript_22585/g.55714 Transcript_22585/m.55714 type:complete len:233 (-) Transcript_22585:306-1004(-)